MISLRSLYVILAAAVLVACGSTDDPGAGGSPDAAATPDPDAGDPPMRPDAAPHDPGLADQIEGDVVGVYAGKMVVATLQELPLLGPAESTATSFGLATIARNGEGFELTETGCRIEVSSTGAVTTTIPDVIPETTPPAVSELAFAMQGDDIVWSRPESVTLIGVDLDDPVNDELPTAGDDPRVFDQDQDSNPGVTVMVSGLASGDIYVVQRNRAAYGGRLDGPGRLSGLVSDSSDQSVVGSSNPVLNQNIPTEPHEDPSLSTVELVRVDDSYDCDKVLAEQENLFP
jgi:hypothetical protein